MYCNELITNSCLQNSLEQNQTAMHFYKEPGRHAIEQVLSRKDIGQCEIKTPSSHLIFKLESVMIYVVY